MAKNIPITVNCEEMYHLVDEQDNVVASFRLKQTAGYEKHKYEAIYGDLTMVKMLLSKKDTTK